MWNLSDARWRRICLKESRAFSVGHEAFWEALSRDDLAEALRAEVEAALYLLRHFEFIYRPGIANDPYVQGRLQELVRAVPDDSIRTLLSEILNSLWLEKRVTVPKPLPSYAHSLTKRGYWQLAQSIWDTIIGAWNDSEAPCARCYIEARTRRAFATREIGDYTDALRDCVIAYHYAEKAELLDLMLRAVVGGSAAVGDGGAKKLGARIALDAAKAAKIMSEPNYEVSARNNAGKCFQQSGRSDLAFIELSLAYEVALTNDVSEAERDIALANVAACAAERGHWKLASDVNELLLTTSQANRARQVALCNLLELYTWQKDEVAFFRTYERIQQTPLNKFVEDNVRVYYTRGIAVFSKSALSKSELEPLETFVSRSQTASD